MNFYTIGIGAEAARLRIKSDTLCIEYAMLLSITKATWEKP